MAVRPVNLNGVETYALCFRRGIGKGGDSVGNVGVAHRLAERIPGIIESRDAVDTTFRQPAIYRIWVGSEMADLKTDSTIRRMDIIDDPVPGLERSF
ncbi:hypothetical protein SKA58_11458 [Sphingomonas sp. SKA58]|nr:hypothetical protein SKA58_11458 [Sphingomonas sp. SKA58]